MPEAKVVLSAVDKTKAAFESAQRNLQSIGDLSGKISGLMGSVGAAIGAAFSAGSIMHMVEMLDQLDKMVEKTGIATEKFSVFRYAGEIADVTQEKLGTGLRKLAKIMAEAAGGSDQAALTFKTLGVEFANADGSLRKTDDVLTDIAQQFRGWEDGPAKAAVAMRLFGKSGDDLIPMLNMGRAGLESMAAEAKALGAVYGGDVTKNAAEFNDNLKRIKLSAEATAISLSGPLVAALAHTSDAFVAAKKSGEGYFGMLSRVANWMPQLPEGLKNSPLFPMLRIFDMMQQGGAALAAPKSTAQIQAYVNKLGLTGGGAGRGWVNPKTVAPVITDTSTNRVKPPDHFADNFINQLITEYANLSGSMSKTEEVTRKLDTATEKFSSTERARALSLAGLIDQQKHMDDAADQAARLIGTQLSAQEHLDDAHYAALGSLEQLAREQAFELTLLNLLPEAIDKARFERELSNQERAAEAALVARGLQAGWDEIRMEEERAKIRRESANARRDFANRQADEFDKKYNPARGMAEGVKTYMDDIAKQGEFARDSVVRAFSSMEDALVNFVKTGKLDFSSLVDSMIGDIARMAIRQSITGPLANSFNFASLFGFASGGIMSSAGPLPLKAYAGGGVADRPQLALFGEGRMNEAFVPLPDGRSIPVAMKGAGQSPINITINTSVGDIASKSDVVAGMRATANSIVARISRAQRYGGALA